MGLFTVFGAGSAAAAGDATTSLVNADRVPTVATMITRVREMADDLGSQPFNPDRAILSWLNDGGAELHSLFVTSYEDYIRARVTITFDGRTPPEYPLPQGLMKSLGMDYLVGGSTSDRRRMEKFGNAERNTRQRILPIRDTIPQYRLVGNVVEIIPNMSSGTAELFYIPEFKRLLDGDAVADKWPYVREGWEVYAILHAVIECALREETDPRAYMEKKAAKKQEIVDMLTPRDAAESWAVTDTQSVRDREEWW